MYKKCYSFIIRLMYGIFTTIFVKIKHVDPIKTGKITDDLYVVKAGTANFYIYKNGEGMICFDSGFGKSQIISELDSLGLDPGDVTHLFLTHSDFDHANGLSLFKNARIYLSADEEQMITRKRARVFRFIYNPGISSKYNLLNDNDVVTVGSTKIKAIATPGHTPGSMSFLVDDHILFVGDTFRLINGRVYPLRYYNMDTEQQKESIKKLACLENVHLACTAHRGYTGKFSEAISHWK